LQGFPSTGVRYLGHVRIADLFARSSTTNPFKPPLLPLGLVEMIMAGSCVIEALQHHEHRHKDKAMLKRTSGALAPDNGPPGFPDTRLINFRAVQNPAL
jgi:hypothetical protein